MKINQRTQYFEADFPENSVYWKVSLKILSSEIQPQNTEFSDLVSFSLESQPQNPEFKNNPGNLHQCNKVLIEDADWYT